MCCDTRWCVWLYWLLLRVFKQLHEVETRGWTEMVRGIILKIGNFFVVEILSYLCSHKTHAYCLNVVRGHLCGNKRNIWQFFVLPFAID